MLMSGSFIAAGTHSERRFSPAARSDPDDPPRGPARAVAPVPLGVAADRRGGDGGDRLRAVPG
jgi:hypothetical protein